MSRKEKVSFTAIAKVTKPVRVSFRASTGRVSFIAKKEVSKPVKVQFYARPKK
jgi:hypothetical protein